MAFPSVAALLDNFNRADGDGLGSNWTEPMVSTDTSSDLDISSNGVISNAGSGVRSSAYWNAATFGPDVEAYVTYVNTPQTNRISEVCARIHEFTSTSPDGYSVRNAAAATDVIRIFRLDDGTYTQLGADINQEFAGGDKLGIECIGDQIAAYRYNAVSLSWSQVGVRTEATYDTAGNVGLAVNHSVPKFDDFYAGTISSGTTYTQSASGGITPSGATAKQGDKPAAGSVTPSGATLKQASKVAAGSITPSGVLAKLAEKIFAGGVTPSGALAAVRTAFAELAGSIVPSGTLARMAGKPLSGSLTPTGSLAKLAAKLFTGGITPSGVLAGIKTVLISLAGGITPSGAISRMAGKSASGTVTPGGTTSKDTAHPLGGSVTPSGTAAKTPQKVMSGAITPSGAITRLVSKIVAGALSLAGALSTLLSGGIDDTSGLATLQEIQLYAASLEEIQPYMANLAEIPQSGALTETASNAATLTETPPYRAILEEI